MVAVGPLVYREGMETPATPTNLPATPEEWDAHMGNVIPMAPYRARREASAVAAAKARHPSNQPTGE